MARDRWSNIRDLTVAADSASMRAAVDVSSAGLVSIEERRCAGERLAQLAARAPSGAVLATVTAKGLVAGSGLTFDDAADETPPARRVAVAPLFRVGTPAPIRMTDSKRPQDDDHRKPNLTRAQIGILHLVAQGRTNREIAALLSRSEHTVYRHVANILTELGVGSRAAAVACAARLLLI